MALTRSFKETVQLRVQRDGAFREALLAEGVDALLAGDMETGKAVLRDYINATIGFAELASATGAPPKSLCACSTLQAIRRPATAVLNATESHFRDGCWRCESAGPQLTVDRSDGGFAG